MAKARPQIKTRKRRTAMVQIRLAPSENGAPTPLSAADELLQEFQRIEDAWKRAEEKLAETRVPVDVRVKVKDSYIELDSGQPVAQETTYLSYSKIKGSRRICVATHYTCYSGQYPDEEDERPVTECPVDVRLEMFDSFQKLYDEANAVAKSYVPKIRDRVDRFLVDLQCIDL
jgi:hypothetical protein